MARYTNDFAFFHLCLYMYISGRWNLYTAFPAWTIDFDWIEGLFISWHR